MGLYENTYFFISTLSIIEKKVTEQSPSSKPKKTRIIPTDRLLSGPSEQISDQPTEHQIQLNREDQRGIDWK
jgi:hypothetical protein